MSSIVHPKTIAPPNTYPVTVNATADRTEPCQKKAQRELEAVQKRINAARLAVQILKDWWCTGADSRSLAKKYNMSEGAVIQTAMAADMQGILMVEAKGMVSRGAPAIPVCSTDSKQNEFTMYEAMAYNNQGYGLSTKAALKKAVEVEEEAQYGRDLAIYHSLGLLPAKYNK